MYLWLYGQLLSTVVWYVCAMLTLVDGDTSVNKLVFLTSRTDNKDSATLVSSGPHGHIHFWNVFNTGSLMAHFTAVPNCFIVMFCTPLCRHHPQLLLLSSIISMTMRLLLDVSICFCPTPEPLLVVQSTSLLLYLHLHCCLATHRLS